MPRKRKLECLLNVVHGYEGLDGGIGIHYSITFKILRSSVRTYTPEFRVINICKIVRAERN